MPFSNPIVGGTTLIRPAIHSPDYEPGVAGWTINKDGTAEFNDVVFRGSAESANYVPGVSGWKLDQDGDAEFNSVVIRGDGDGDIIIAGPDDGSQVVIGANPGDGYIEFPTNRPIEDLPGSIVAGTANDGAANESASLQLQGPTVTGATNRAAIHIDSQANDGSTGSSVGMTADASAFLLDEGSLAVAPGPSGSSAFRMIADTGHTGNVVRIQKGSTDVFVINNAGNADFSGTLTAHNIQKGVAAITTVAGQWAEVTVTFPHAFSATPVVTVTGNNNAPAVGGTTQLYSAATTVTTTGFVLRVFRQTAIAMNFGWIAIA